MPDDEARLKKPIVSQPFHTALKVRRDRAISARRHDTIMPLDACSASTKYFCVSIGRFHAIGMHRVMDTAHVLDKIGTRHRITLII
jgi:hypothetical protein